MVTCTLKSYVGFHEIRPLGLSIDRSQEKVKELLELLKAAWGPDAYKAIPFQNRGNPYVAIRSAACVILSTIGYTQEEFYREIGLCRTGAAQSVRWHTLASQAAMREEPWALEYQQMYLAGLEAVKPALPEGVWFVPLAIRPLGELSPGDLFRLARCYPAHVVGTVVDSKGFLRTTTRCGWSHYLDPQRAVIHVQGVE